jgi:invasion protein IalB
MSGLRLFLVAATMAGVAAVADVPGAGPAMAQQPAKPAATATLPNGASAINETFGDWVVDCRLIDGQKSCALIQGQVNSQTRQRVFEIQLRPPKDGKADGTVLMPFGLKLDNGAVVTLDDKDLGQPLRFSTCLPQGCLLPVSFPAAAIDAMKKGKVLNIASLNLGNGEVVAFKVSLEGFPVALARITELGK